MFINYFIVFLLKKGGWTRVRKGKFTVCRGARGREKGRDKAEHFMECELECTCKVCNQTCSPWLSMSFNERAALSWNLPRRGNSRVCLKLDVMKITAYLIALVPGRRALGWKILISLCCGMDINDVRTVTGRCLISWRRTSILSMYRIASPYRRLPRQTFIQFCILVKTR